MLVFEWGRTLQVGLLPASSTWQTPLFMINRLVDLMFLVDIYVNFFLAYYSDKLGRWEFVHHKIIHRYLTGWYVPVPPHVMLPSPLSAPSRTFGQRAAWPAMLSLTPSACTGSSWT